jgi:hypothetical protein
MIDREIASSERQLAAADRREAAQDRQEALERVRAVEDRSLSAQDPAAAARERAAAALQRARRVQDRAQRAKTRLTGHPDQPQHPDLHPPRVRSSWQGLRMVAVAGQRGPVAPRQVATWAARSASCDSRATQLGSQRGGT